MSQENIIENKQNDEIVCKKKREMNKLTRKANLNFNVNLFKKWIKQKLLSDEKMVTVIDKNDKTQITKKLPNFKGSPVALAAMNEKLCYIILEKVIERLTKSKNGLYVIKYNDLSDIIKIDIELRRNLYHYMDTYDTTLNYRDQYCISEKHIKEYIDKTFSASIDINNEAFNLLVYLLLKSCVRVIDTSYVIMCVAHKKTLSHETINGCIAIHYCGTTAHLLKMKIDESTRLCGKELLRNDNEGELANIDEKPENNEHKNNDSDQSDDE